jgi:threonine dehydrogenase-like Zn-dependent dehydrogenase
VIGLGLLGQLTLQLLKAAGCRVIGIDLDQSKIELARALGADVAALRGDALEAVEAATQGYGADAVIVTAAAETNDPIELAGHIARDRAVVSLVGSVRLDVPRRVYYEKELQIRLSRSCMVPDAMTLSTRRRGLTIQLATCVGLSGAIWRNSCGWSVQGR